MGDRNEEILFGEEMNVEYETRPANPGFAGYKSAKLIFEKDEIGISESFADLFDFALNLCIVGKRADVEAIVESAADEMKAILKRR